MKKRVEVGDLKLGMYICELDRPWGDPPFVAQGIAINTPEQITQLRQHCEFVFIETDLEMPILATHVDTVPQPPVGFSRLNRPELELEILKKYSDPGFGQDRHADTVNVEEEISTIQATHLQALELMDDIMRAVRHGRHINTAATLSIVSVLTDSVLRNPDALVCLTLPQQIHAPAAQHSVRTCVLALVLGRHLGMRTRQLHELGIGALLHDIGKARVPLEILECGNPLNEEETRILRKHVADGVAILESTPGIPLAAVDVARYHHEHFDGSGYISGLRKNEISQFGHIGAIVNFYDKLTRPSPATGSVAAYTALKVMYEKRATLFHPHLVEEFIRCMGIYPIGSIVEMRSGEIGVVVALNRDRRLKPRVALVLDSNHQHLDHTSVVDLSRYRNYCGEVLEIANVAENNTYDFDPMDYLPIVA
jgi:putative nucleotidyltransferase with HDIG domain